MDHIGTIILNDKDLKTALPRNEAYQIWDDKTTGLHVIVSPQGVKSFYLRYQFGGRRLRKKIGLYMKSGFKEPETTLATARRLARNYLNKISEGIDPFLETKRKVQQEEADALAKAARKTFAQLADDYIELYGKPHLNTVDKMIGMLERDVYPVIGAMALEDIKRQHISDIVTPIMKRGAKVQPNRVFEIVRQIFNWGIEQGRVGDMEYVPTDRMKPPMSKPISRDRFLSAQEIREVWSWLEQSERMNTLSQYVFKLILITGQRPGEVCQIQKSHISTHGNRHVWTIPAELHKNKVPHMVPLSEMAIEILQTVEDVKQDLDSPRRTNREPRFINSPFVFPSPQKLGRSFSRSTLNTILNRARKNEMTLERWVPHDLRRTCGTHITGMVKETREIMDQVLGHKNSKIGAVYDRYAYFDEKCRALDGWSRELRRILDGDRPAKVIPLYR